MTGALGRVALGRVALDSVPLGRRRGPRLYRRLDSRPPAAAEPSGRAIGLLGGSFNPAHEGHRYISSEALKRLALDEVWWLVSPQNPLKPKAGMAPFAERVRTARRAADHPRIRVSTIEARLSTRYTVATLGRLAALSGQRFIWLIGADNLEQLPRWHRWERIFALAPIAVFHRAPYSKRALTSKAATRYAPHRVAEAAAPALKDKATPAWTFIHLPPHPASSTAIRAGRTRSPNQENRP